MKNCFLVLVTLVLFAGCWDFGRLTSGCVEKVWWRDCRAQCAPPDSPVAACVLDASGNPYYFSPTGQQLDGRVVQLDTPPFQETCDQQSTQFFVLAATAPPSGTGVLCEGGGAHVFGAGPYYRASTEVSP